VAGCCEHGDEQLGSVECEKTLTYLKMPERLKEGWCVELVRRLRLRTQGGWSEVG
jgi:hypothetical protein